MRTLLPVEGGRSSLLISRAAVLPVGLRRLAAARPGQRASLGLLVRAASSENGATMGGGDGGKYDYDLFTIGAGSGGVRATRFAASNYGIKAAICELPFAMVSSDEAGGAGGTCVLRGCVPKKLMVFGGEFHQSFADSEGFGWQVKREGGALPEVDWGTFMGKKRKELERLNGVYMKMLNQAKVDFHEGFGRVLDAHTVEVAGKRFTAKNILLATGARAFIPPSIEGHELCITSDEILDLPERPRKLAIVGGGYIAVEFAGIFNNFGGEVHLLYRQPLPLRGFDQEVREFVTDQYREVGLNLHPETSPSRISRGPDGKLVLEAKGKDGTPLRLEGLDQVLMATGRKPNSKKLNLESAGVATDEKSGQVKVDRFSRTNVPSVWALGDVTDRVALTPVALMEGMAFARHVFGGDADAAPDYDAIASAVFGNPPLAYVGLSEEAAKEKVGDVDVYTSTFRPMKNTISGNPTKAMMKLLVDARTDRVLGVHMVGYDSAEILQGFAVAVKMGLTKRQLDSVVGIHPTSAEEFVTMRSVTRKLRRGEPQPAEAKA